MRQVCLVFFYAKCFNCLNNLRLGGSYQASCCLNMQCKKKKKVVSSNNFQ